jgi:HlyD family secretion protein
MRDHTIGNLAECSEFRQTLQARPPAVVHGAALLLAALLAAAVCWAALAQADLVVQARGRLRPEHPAAPAAAPAGRVAEVRYREGDTVKRGDVLMRMDTERLDNEIGRKRRAVQGYEEELARLARQEQLLAAQREQTLARAQAELRQTREEVRQARERRESDLGLHKDELELAADVEKRMQGLGKNTSLLEVLQARQTRRKAETDLAKVRLPIDESRIDVARLALALAEKEADVRREELVGTRTRTRAELDAARLELANLEVELRRAAVRAPCDGVVITPEKHAGDLVEHDQVVAEVAPPGGFVFEAVVPGEEVGHLKVGLPVRIKLDAFDFQKYGTLAGEVVHLSADSKVPEGGGRQQAVYVVKVAVASEEVGHGGVRGRLRLGMDGRAEIVTGRHSLLAVLLKQVRQSVNLN